MNTTDSTRLAKTAVAIGAAKNAHHRMQNEIADLLKNGEWMHSQHIERIWRVQAEMWVYDRLEHVLERVTERPEYTLPGRVAALRSELDRMLRQASLGMSTSEATNAQERAKILALQTIITTGPLAI